MVVMPSVSPSRQSHSQTGSRWALAIRWMVAWRFLIVVTLRRDPLPAMDSSLPYGLHRQAGAVRRNEGLKDGDDIVTIG